MVPLSSKRNGSLMHCQREKSSSALYPGSRQSQMPQGVQKNAWELQGLSALHWGLAVVPEKHLRPMGVGAS